MVGLYALLKKLALKNCFFFYLQCWVLSSGTEQSFVAAMESGHICHAVPPQETIDFPIFVQ